MSRIRCPICDQFFEPEKSLSLPFCSERCKQIDLSRWLDEKYALPVERPDDRPQDEHPQDES